MTCSTGRSVRVVRMWICRVLSWPSASLPVLLLATVRLTCRIVNTSPASLVGRSTVVSATRQAWARPVSSTYVRSVNRSGSMFSAKPLRQVNTSKPAASMYANNFGDQPPRSNPTNTRRVSPTARRRSGSSRRSSIASDAPGAAMTISTGSLQRRTPRFPRWRGRGTSTVGLGDLSAALVGADAPVDVAHRPQVRGSRVQPGGGGGGGPGGGRAGGVGGGCGGWFLGGGCFAPRARAPPSGGGLPGQGPKDS